MKLSNAVLWLILLAACPLDAGESNNKTVLTNGKATVTIPKVEKPDQLLVLRVSVGPMPVRSSVVVHAENGEVIGTISAFPPGASKEGGTYSFPISARLAANPSVTLVFRVEKTGEKSRPPTDKEVTAWKIVAQ